jgi:hypothetical protein
LFEQAPNIKRGIKNMPVMDLFILLVLMSTNVPVQRPAGFVNIHSIFVKIHVADEALQ